MKICMIAPFGLPPKHNGGAEVYSLNLYLGLAKLGHEIHVFLPIDSAEPIRMQNIFLHFVKTSREDLNLCNTFFYIYEIFKAKEVNFDIIHGQNPNASGLAAYISSKLLNIPCVITNHGRGLVLREQEDKVNKLKKLSRLREYFIKNLLKRCEMIIVHNDYIRELHEKRLDVKFSKISVIIPSILKPSLKNAKLLKITHPTILTVTRLDKQKNVDKLISAMNLVAKKHTNAKLFIVGDGPEKVYLKNLVIYNQLNNNINFLSNVSDEYLGSMYNSADIFILPSPAEGFGIVFLEAWALHKPVIGINNPPVSNMIKNVNGGLLSNNDSFDLSKKICELIENNELQIELGENGYSFVEKNCSENKFLHKHLKVYTTVLRNSN